MYCSPSSLFPSPLRPKMVIFPLSRYPNIYSSFSLLLPPFVFLYFYLLFKNLNIPFLILLPSGMSYYSFFFFSSKDIFPLDDIAEISSGEYSIYSIYCPVLPPECISKLKIHFSSHLNIARQLLDILQKGISKLVLTGVKCYINQKMPRWI
jgi:hypothetical protein